MNVLYVIPSRGGSKGIKKKNLALLCGKPLLGWTIDEALKAKHKGIVVVSSDDEEMVEYAKERGVEAPFIRPPSLSTDSSSRLDVLEHAVRYYNEKRNFLVDVVVCLQPTSPLRTAEDIDNCLDIYCKNPGTSVVSLSEVAEHPAIMRVVDNGVVFPYDQSGFGKDRRQDYIPVYVLNGAVFITPAYDILRQRVLCPIQHPYIMEKERSIDIDTIEDLRMAEFYINAAVSG